MRLLTEPEQKKLEEHQEQIHYSNRYSDDKYEYRHVMLPKQMLKVIPKDYFDEQSGTLRLLAEDEWRGLGITQVRYQPIAARQLTENLEFRLGPLRNSSTGTVDFAIQAG